MDSPLSRFRISASIFSDILLTIASLIGATYAWHWWEGSEFLRDTTFDIIVIFISALWALTLSLGGCYERKQRLRIRKIAKRVLRSLVVAHLLLALVLFYSGVEALSRAVVGIFFVVNYAAIIAGRLCISKLAVFGHRPRTLIIGTDENAIRLARSLAREELQEIVGYVGGPWPQEVPDSIIIGKLIQIDRILTDQAPLDQVGVAVPLEYLPSLGPAIQQCEDRGLAVRQLLCRLGNESRDVVLERVGGTNIQTSRPYSASPGALLMKRTVDVIGALLGLLLSLVVFPLIAIAIKITSRGPVFYRQQRVGLNGRTFSFYKFRTMVDGAHELRDQFAHLNEANGPHFKIKNDPRLTQVGKLLRRSSLDELPQFWNVLRGDMSLVGPRPFPVAEVEKQDNSHYRRLSMKPGITGMWQTNGRSEVNDFSHILELDESYIRNWSLWLDIKLMFWTIPAVFKGRGAM